MLEVTCMVMTDIILCATEVPIPLQHRLLSAIAPHLSLPRQPRPGTLPMDVVSTRRRSKSLFACELGHRWSRSLTSIKLSRLPG